MKTVKALDGCTKTQNINGMLNGELKRLDVSGSCFLVYNVERKEDKDKER